MILISHFLLLFYFIFILCSNLLEFKDILLFHLVLVILTMLHHLLLFELNLHFYNIFQFRRQYLTLVILIDTQIILHIKYKTHFPSILDFRFFQLTNTIYSHYSLHINYFIFCYIISNVHHTELNKHTLIKYFFARFLMVMKFIDEKVVYFWYFIELL